MKFAIKNSDIGKQQKTALIVGIFEKGKLSPSAARLDKLSHGYISTLLKQGEGPQKIGQILMLYHVPHLACERILLVGCGQNNSLKASDYRKIITSSIKAIAASKATNVVSYLAELAVEKHDVAWRVKQAIETASEALYCFDTYKSVKKPDGKLKEIIIHLDSHHLKVAKNALQQGLAIAEGVTYTKNIANQPSNVCTPSYLAEQAKALAKTHKSIRVKILEESDMKKLGMGAFLAVTQGSAQPPKMVCLEYKGAAANQAPVALVGKGITFDTGGISLKPADSMPGMKYDMCGAATVLGTLKAVASLKLPLNLIGILAAAENMPSGTACKPEDIVTTLSRQTVEIMNTDAEGRLVLCDALTYCERYNPAVVIDIATLTGAVVIALGHHASGLLANNELLAKALLAAGEQSFDRAWQLPLWDEYQEQLKSPFADMSNVGGRAGGVITAACFLSRFTKKYHWAHLDVAGTAAMMMAGSDRYATGRPVPLLVQYLINRCQANS